MSQITKTDSEKKLWVLVSSLRQNTTGEDLERVSTSVSELVNEWQSKGKFIWSGSLGDKKTGLAIFEGTRQEANRFYNQYAKICSGLLDFNLSKWDALPLLGLF